MLLLSMSVMGGDIKGNVYDQVTTRGTKELMIMSRIFKNYIMMQMNNHYQNPQKKIEDKIQKFTIEQDALMALEVDDETKALLKQQEKLWKDAKAFVQNPPKGASLKQFRKYFIPLKESVQKLVQNSKTKAIRKHEESVLYAGKLFVLPQRLATFYLLQGTNPQKAEQMRKQMSKEIEKYKEYLSKLDALSKNFPEEIQKEIKQLHKNLGYFQYLESGVTTFVPTLAYKKTDRMSERAKKLMFMLAGK